MVVIPVYQFTRGIQRTTVSTFFQVTYSTKKVIPLLYPKNQSVFDQKSSKNQDFSDKIKCNF